MRDWNGTKRTIACGMLVATLSACAGSPDSPQGLTAQGPAMQPAERVQGAVAWRKPDLDPTQYTRFMVSPVQVYDGADANYHGASNAEKQAMAQFMQQEFTKVLGEQYPITSAPGPKTARLDLTLAGMSGNIPVASTAAAVMPLGLMRNLVAGGQSPIVSGSVTYKGELYDAQTGELLAAFVTSKSPSALDLGATMSSQTAQRAAITESAKDLREAIGSAQQAAMSPTG